MKEVIWKEIEPIIYNEHNKDTIYFLEFISKRNQEWKVMNKIIQKVEEYFKNNNKVVFLQIDADESSLFNNLNSNFEVIRIPTHIIMVNKKIIFKGYDNYPKEIFIDVITNILN